MSLLTRIAAEQRAAMRAAIDAALVCPAAATAPPAPPLTVDQLATLAKAEAVIREIEDRFGHLRDPYCPRCVNRIA